MSKLVNSEFYNLVDKLDKAGLSYQVAIEAIRQSKDYHISKLTRSEQVYNLQGKVNAHEVEVILLKQKVDAIKENLVTMLNLSQFKEEVHVNFAYLRRNITRSGRTLIKWFIMLFATQVISIFPSKLPLFLK